MRGGARQAPPNRHGGTPKLSILIAGSEAVLAAEGTR